MSPEISTGDTVRSIRTGQQGRVVGLSRYSVEVLFFGAKDTVDVSHGELERIDRTPSVLDPPQLLAQLSAYKISTGLSDVLYAYLASRTTFREYQFLPALRFLESPSRRLLIADEVGLGKTIEAGLILLELLARGHADRILIVVPPHLRSKWQMELLRRFDIEADIWLGRDIDAELDRVRQFPSAIRDDQVVIVSHQVISMSTSLDMGESEAPSRTELMADLGITWDVVIVDEAHHGRNRGTRRNQAFNDLGRISDALLFLTATPLNLGNEDLFNLLQILRPDLFRDFEAFGGQIEPARFVTEAVRALKLRDSALARASLEKIASTEVGTTLARTSGYRAALTALDEPGEMSWQTVSRVERDIRSLHPLAGVFTRTRKRDLPQPFAQRDARRLHVQWTPEEWEFYDALRQHVVTQQMSSPFALVMPSRQSASCIPAMAERLRENGWITSPSDWALDVEESEEIIDLPSRPIPVAAGTGDRLRLATEAVEGIDTKYDVFSAAVREVLNGEANQILVFSFFRKTIEYLRRRLTSDGFRVEVINGGVPMEKREDLISRFRRGEFDILLSSEVGSEGLDFEFVACLFNYDLPWNPMVVEQRIGRLDRFGQVHERILIFNLQIPGTIETDIIDRLYERIGVFERSIGELDEIVGEYIESELGKRLATLTLTDEEKQRLQDQIDLAIEKQRLVAEELESHRDVLAASAELLDEQFSTIRNRGRYVDPDEVRRLVQAAITSWYPDATWQSSDSIHEVRLPANALRAGPLADVLRSKELIGLGNKVNFGSALRFTFDYETASRNVGVTFLTARHPLVQSIARLVQDRGPSRPFRGSIALGRADIPSGSYVCWIMEAHVQSLNERVELFPIAIREGGSRCHELEGVILGELSRHVPEAADIAPAVDRGDLELAVDELRGGLIEEEELRFDLELAQKRQVITASHQAKAASLEKVLAETRGTQVEKANEARLASVRNTEASQLGALARAKAPTVHVRHLAELTVLVRPRASDGSDHYSVPAPIEDVLPTYTPSRHRRKPSSGRARTPAGHFICTRCDLTKRRDLQVPGQEHCVDCE